jgi:hypothetical protein
MLAERLARHERVPTYDAFEHLCWVAFPDGPKGQMMAMLTAYLDESYNHSDKPTVPLVYTVAAYISTRERWSRFGKQWKSALRSKGLDHFHMSKFENRIGAYADWDNAERHGFLRRLKQIIKANTLYGASLSVNCADYDDLIQGEVRTEWGKTYYGFCVRLLLKHLGEWAEEQNHPGSIHYVFAELAKQGGELDRIFTRCLKDPEVRQRYKLNGMWTKGLMREIVQLQAADVMAYELNKRAVNQFGVGLKTVRKSLDIFQYDRDRFAPLYISRKEILKLFSKSGYTATPKV